MCLAVPGRVESIRAEGGEFERVGEVNFGGAIRRVNLALVPEAQVGDYVIAHVGMALCVLDEHEARRSLALFEQLAARPDGAPGPDARAASEPPPEPRE